MNALFDRSTEELNALFRSWDKAWNNNEIYGFALAESIFKKNFLAESFSERLAGVFDNNPNLHHTVMRGLPVLLPDAIKTLDGKKIITFYGYYPVIADQLLKMGLREYDDFMDYRIFLSFYHWYGNAKVFLPTVDIALTLNCTLRCEGCNMFSPYQMAPRNFSLNELKSDADLLFSAVDTIQLLAIVGGEPLLHQNLAEYIQYLGRNYRSKINDIGIVTNGTIRPSPKVLTSAADNGVVFFVSDYSEAGIHAYDKKLSILLDDLKAWNIPHTVWSGWPWYKHHCDDNQLAALPGAELKNHFIRCQRARACHGFKDGIFYPCLKTWSAELGGFSSNAPDDMIDFKATETTEALRFKLFRYIQGSCDNGFLQHCKQCYGFDPAYLFEIPKAKQI